MQVGASESGAMLRYAPPLLLGDAALRSNLGNFWQHLLRSLLGWARRGSGCLARFGTALALPGHKEGRLRLLIANARCP